MLRKRDYDRFIYGVDTVSAPENKLSIMQTPGSNSLLYTLASEGHSSNGEMLVADLLLSGLISANKDSFYKWKKARKDQLEDVDWKKQAWPVSQVDLSSYLTGVALQIYRNSELSRPDVSIKKWINHVYKVLEDSPELRSRLEVQFDPNTSMRTLTFSPSTIDKVASIYLLPSLEMPRDLYKFPGGADTRCPYAFYVNRTLFLHFMIPEVKEAKAWPQKLTHSLKRWLTLLALPTLEQWKNRVQSGNKIMTPNTWFLNVVQKPIQQYALFKAEMDMRTGEVTLTRQFKTSEEEKAEVKEDGK